jgi:NAD(P)-dependent dehydrogenase (short-subunit alcohol dehydrogenase family)
MSDGITGATLAGKLALVTGASRGLGRAIAEVLAAAGCDVACVATHAENAAATVAAITAAGRRALAFGCRVERADEVTTLFAAVQEAFGPLDILVNNAGISQPTPLLQMTEENWDLHMDVNVKSVFLCAQAATRQMKDSGRGGSIINIGSILGQNAVPQTLGYCASKAAVDHMTRVLAIELAKYRIRVNCIAPGYVKTDLIETLVREGKMNYEAMGRRTPLRRLGTGEEIGRAVVYVASEAAAFMTGHVMVLDGGWTAYGYL